MIEDENTKNLIDQEALEQYKKEVCERYILNELTNEQIELGEKRTRNKYDKKLKKFIRRKSNG